jgi:hypothetical protein
VHILAEVVLVDANLAVKGSFDGPALGNAALKDAMDREVAIVYVDYLIDLNEMMNDSHFLTISISLF